MIHAMLTQCPDMNTHVHNHVSESISHFSCWGLCPWACCLRSLNNQPIGASPVSPGGLKGPRDLGIIDWHLSFIPAPRGCPDRTKENPRRELSHPCLTCSPWAHLITAYSL